MHGEIYQPLAVIIDKDPKKAQIFRELLDSRNIDSIVVSNPDEIPDLKRPVDMALVHCAYDRDMEGLGYAQALIDKYNPIRVICYSGTIGGAIADNRGLDKYPAVAFKDVCELALSLAPRARD